MVGESAGRRVDGFRRQESVEPFGEYGAVFLDKFGVDSGDPELPCIEVRSWVSLEVIDGVEKVRNQSLGSQCVERPFGKPRDEPRLERCNQLGYAVKALECG